MADIARKLADSKNCDLSVYLFSHYDRLENVSYGDWCLQSS